MPSVNQVQLGTITNNSTNLIRLSEYRLVFFSIFFGGLHHHAAYQSWPRHHRGTGPWPRQRGHALSWRIWFCLYIQDNIWKGWVASKLLCQDWNRRWRKSHVQGYATLISDIMISLTRYRWTCFSKRHSWCSTQLLPAISRSWRSIPAQGSSLPRNWLSRSGLFSPRWFRQNSRIESCADAHNARAYSGRIRQAHVWFPSTYMLRCYRAGQLLAGIMGRVLCW